VGCGQLSFVKGIGMICAENPIFRPPSADGCSRACSAQERRAAARADQKRCRRSRSRPGYRRAAGPERPRLYSGLAELVWHERWIVQ
jgi:hypothetical protein